MHMMLTRVIPAAVDLDPWWLSWPGACLGRPGHLGVLAAVAKMAGTCMSRARPYGRAKIRVNGRWYDTVAELVACARARWKIENESFNVLKSNGYHLEHNFGHGKQNLAMMFAALNLLAFAIHTVCDCLEQLWIDDRTAKRARKRFSQHIKSIPAYPVFPNWKTLMQTLIDSKPPPDVEA